ncbi:unnamed protein product [Schistocephalus solidus]|uniref:Ileal sodium/bile acid cotransporter n=1 Tax=Schistocephalus solidus TaxID=70667 RepID=A0A183TIZ5_SCHSO|nr:unnamed protein product [Schistocephalus solidus]
MLALGPFSCLHFLLSLLLLCSPLVLSLQNDEGIGGLPVNHDYIDVRRRVDRMTKENSTHLTTFFTTDDLNISFSCEIEQFRLTEYSEEFTASCFISYASKAPRLLAYTVDRPVSLLLPPQNVTTLPMTLGAIVDFSITLKPEQLGLAYVLIYASPLNSTADYEPLLVSGFRILILRKSGIVDRIFRIGLIILLFVVSFLMGCELDIDILRKHLRKPIGPVIGFSCQFILMPAIALALAKLCPISPEFGFGLFVIGSAPGGGASNVWTRLLGGDLNLSITMTLISSLAALGMIPLLLFTLGNLLNPLSVGRLPYGMITVQILYIFLPIAGSLLLRRIRPSLADKLRLGVRPTALIFLLYVVIFGSVAYLPIYRLMARYPLLLVAGATLPYVGFLLGFIFARLLCRPWPVVTAIAIETGVQNSGVAILILINAMPQPEGDMGAIMPIIVALMTPLPLLCAFLVHSLVSLVKRKKEKMSPTELDDSDAI